MLRVSWILKELHSLCVRRLTKSLVCMVLPCFAVGNGNAPSRYGQGKKIAEPSLLSSPAAHNSERDFCVPVSPGCSVPLCGQALGQCRGEGPRLEERRMGALLPGTSLFLSKEINTLFPGAKDQRGSISQHGGPRLLCDVR